MTGQTAPAAARRPSSPCGCSSRSALRAPLASKAPRLPRTRAHSAPPELTPGVVGPDQRAFGPGPRAGRPAEPLPAWPPPPCDSGPREPALSLRRGPCCSHRSAPTANTGSASFRSGQPATCGAAVVARRIHRSAADERIGPGLVEGGVSEGAPVMRSLRQAAPSAAPRCRSHARRTQAGRQARHSARRCST